MFEVALDFYSDHPNSILRLIRFTNFDPPTVRVFVAVFDERLKPADPRTFDDILDEAEANFDEVNNSACGLIARVHLSSCVAPSQLRREFGLNDSDAEVDILGDDGVRFRDIDDGEDVSSSEESFEGGFCVTSARSDYPEDDDGDMGIGSDSDDDPSIF